MKRFVILTAILFSNFHIYPQKDTSFNRNIAKNTIYLEALGNGSLGSLNYDRLFLFKNQKLSYSIGLLMMPNRWFNSKSYNLFFSIPLEINFLFGNKHYFVSGLGLTLVHGEKISYKYQMETSTALWIFLKLSEYRFQIKNGGLFFSTSLGLVYNLFDFNKLIHMEIDKNTTKIRPIFSISLGYTFKTKKT